MYLSSLVVGLFVAQIMIIYESVALRQLSTFVDKVATEEEQVAWLDF